jgi:hypothetical protein
VRSVKRFIPVLVFTASLMFVAIVNSAPIVHAASCVSGLRWSNDFDNTYTDSHGDTARAQVYEWRDVLDTYCGKAKVHFIDQEVASVCNAPVRNDVIHVTTYIYNNDFTMSGCGTSTSFDTVTFTEPAGYNFIQGVEIDNQPGYEYSWGLNLG